MQSSRRDLCIVCGNPQCNESTDHQFMNQAMLADKLLPLCANDPVLCKLKAQVKNYYASLLKSIRQELFSIQGQMQSYLNMFYFANCQGFSIDDKKIAGRILEPLHKRPKHIWSCRQKNQIKKLIRMIDPSPSVSSNKSSVTLTKDSQSNSEKSNTKGSELWFEMINKKIKMALTEDLKNEIVTCIQNKLRFDYQEEHSAGFQLHDIPEARQKSFQSMNTFYEEQLIEIPNLEWHIPLRKTLKSLPLSNKRINDSEALINLPKLANFPNIKELQLRNNQISYLTCMSICQFTPQILMIDLRSVKRLCVRAFQKLSSLKLLKQLMISQCEITDVQVNQICKGFQSLEILDAENNEITEVGTRGLGNKESLKILNVANNPIDPTYFEELKTIFRRKGRIAL